MSGNFIYRHRVEPGVKLYVPTESFPIPLRYIDVIRRTHTSLDVLQENRSSQHKLKNLQTGMCGPGAADKKNKQQHGLIICGQKFGQ